jgi:hypothetical protein
MSPIPLHDWALLSETLDWRLGKLAYQARGTLTFTSNEVPNIAHQGGLIPYRAAAVLLASCAEADAAGTLEDEIACLELGMGLGLFAAQVLDRFRDRCATMGVDWYDRLVWYATDATPTVLTHAHQSGILTRHSARVRFAQASALDPSRLHTPAGSVTLPAVRAIFHSYVLCMLPMNLYRVEGESAEVTVARTVIKDPSLLPRFTHRSPDDIRALVAADDPQAVLPLVGLYPLLDLELARTPLDPTSQSLPRVRQIADWIRAERGLDAQEPVWVLDSEGAWRSISQSLSLLRPDGFLLCRDYGPDRAEAADDQHLYQHYGATIAVQVNHFALRRLAEQSGTAVTAPDSDGEQLLKTRLYAAGDIPQTRTAFRRAYDLADVAALKAAVSAARHAPSERLAAAYDAAIALEPGNWALLTEAAEAIYARLSDPGQAYTLLRRSLAINEPCQAVAWDLLGEMFIDAGQWDQAHAALKKAAAINPEHARVHAATARLHRAQGDIEAALSAAARAVSWAEAGGHDGQVEALNALVAELVDRRELERSLRAERAAGGYHRRQTL